MTTSLSRLIAVSSCLNKFMWHELGNANGAVSRERLNVRLSPNFGPRAESASWSASCHDWTFAVVVLPAIAGATSSRVDRQECAAQIVPWHLGGRGTFRGDADTRQT